MIIKVLGPGCMNCRTLEKRTAEAVKNLNINAGIEKVTDYNSILSFGIVRTPGLIIDGKKAVEGRVPTVEEIQKLIEQYSQ